MADDAVLAIAGFFLSHDFLEHVIQHLPALVGMHQVCPSGKRPFIIGGNAEDAVEDRRARPAVRGNIPEIEAQAGDFLGLEKPCLPLGQGRLGLLLGLDVHCTAKPAENRAVGIPPGNCPGQVPMVGVVRRPMKPVLGLVDFSPGHVFALPLHGPCHVVGMQGLHPSVALGFFGGLPGVLLPAAVAVDLPSLGIAPPERVGNQLRQQTVSLLAFPQCLLGLPAVVVGRFQHRHPSPRFRQFRDEFLLALVLIQHGKPRALVTTTRQDVKTVVRQAFQPDSEQDTVRLESLTYLIFWRVVVW